MRPGEFAQRQHVISARDYRSIQLGCFADYECDWLAKVEPARDQRGEGFAVGCLATKATPPRTPRRDRARNAPPAAFLAPTALPGPSAISATASGGRRRPRVARKQVEPTARGRPFADGNYKKPGLRCIAEGPRRQRAERADPLLLAADRRSSLMAASSSAPQASPGERFGFASVPGKIAEASTEGHRLSQRVSGWCGLRPPPRPSLIR